MIIRLHGTILSFIRRLPSHGETAFRVYHKILRAVGPRYTARTFFDANIHCDLNDLIQSYIFHFGVWEPEITDVVVKNLAPGDVFVDVGANIGYDSLLAAWRVGSGGKVVAVEASPRAFALLQENLKLNTYAKNVRAVQVAASDRPGRLNLYDVWGKYNMGAVTTIGNRGGVLVATVEARPMLEILDPGEIERVRLIKIDVEGAESAVMLNILDSLDRFPPTMDIVVETSPADDEEASKRVFSRMKAAGFHAYKIENDWRRERYLSERPLAPLLLTETLPAHQCDLFYTRRQM